MNAGRNTLLALAVLATAAVAAAAPLWTYALSLALFGLPHVLVELRYVDERFSARLPRRTIVWLAAGLAAIVAVRLCAFGGLGTGTGRVMVELLLGGGITAAAVPLLLPRRQAAIAITMLAALLAGAALAPLATLVTLSLLHNLTPVGFLTERLRGRERRRALVICAIVFAAIPLLLLGGALDPIVAPFAMAPTTPGPFGTAPLDAHLPVFVPSPLLGTAFADRLFATAAFLQCMHYAVVLHVLPRLSGGAERSGEAIAWPRAATWAAVLAMAALLFTIGFGYDFARTRSIYAVFAAVHAWLELPILALAAGVLPRHATAMARAA
ncbi:MAG: hypothetical protein KDC98_03600 [Planctomycetes bacterium]|nr:hypothetical protein [Planctomycetota bacterium]